jgi:hypothetical protein
VLLARAAGYKALAALAALARRLLWRAALFGWMSPLRAARSRRTTATFLASGVEPAAFAFFNAVRSAERCARLRTVAARDFRIFFSAEAIFGTKNSGGAVFE